MPEKKEINSTKPILQKRKKGIIGVSMWGLLILAEKAQKKIDQAEIPPEMLELWAGHFIA